MPGCITEEMHGKISGQPHLLILYCHLLLFQSMLFVEIPEYRNKHIRTAVKVNFYVINGKRKRSQPQHFTYHPGNSQGQSKSLPSCHEQDFVFCCVVFLPLFEDLSFTNLIQPSAAKHSTTVCFKGCVWFMIRNFHEFKGTVILAIGWWWPFHLMEVCQQPQWDQSQSVTWCDPVKTMSVAFPSWRVWQ